MSLPSEPKQKDKKKKDYVKSDKDGGNVREKDWQRRHGKASYLICNVFNFHDDFSHGQ